MSQTEHSATLSAGHAPRTFFGQPAGLATLFFTEMWERMSFYGMRAILVLFLTGSLAHSGLALDDRTADAIYGLYTAGTYIAGLPGGWIADRLLGQQRAVLIGGIIIAIGHLILGSAATRDMFYAGLAVIVIGTGLLKPNASAMVAQLYPEGGARRDAGYTAYYMGINIGGAVGPLVVGYLAVTRGWGAGFMAAAVGMALGVLQFFWGRRLLGAAGRTPPAVSNNPRRDHGVLIGVAAALLALVLLLGGGMLPISPLRLENASSSLIIAVSVLYFVLLAWRGKMTPLERRRLLAALVLFIASVLFWTGYEQGGSSLNLFAERFTDRGLFGFTVPASWLQSLESVFIITGAPLLSALWIQLGRRNLDPHAPVKFIFGLLGIAAGFIVMAVAARIVAAGHSVGMGWLTTTYLLHTTGELCLSPVGMSAYSKLLPERFVGQALGLWFVSLSLGNLLAGRVAGEFDATNLAAMPGQFMRLVWFMCICAVGVLLLLPVMRRWMAGAR